jgi:hypothetical protein
MKRLWIILLSSLLLLIVLPSQAAYRYESVFVTSQRYDGGDLIWRSDTGTILLLANDGQVQRYPISSYGSLPPNPFRVPPIGKIAPMMGFGKVWANYNEARAKLGWAFFPEVGRDTPIVQIDDGSIYLLNHYAQVIRIQSNNTWQQVDDFPDNPYTKGDPIIQSFNVSPDEASHGETITVSWDIDNVDSVIVEFYDAYPRNDIMYNLQDRLPTLGNTSLDVPLTTLHGITVVIYGVRYDALYNGYLVTARVIDDTRTIKLKDKDTPPEPEQTWAVHQQYDNGFMLWRANTGMITVFRNDGTLKHYPLTYYAYLSDSPNDIDVPADKVLPTNGFGRVWAYLDNVREALGWAITNEKGYTLTIKPLEEGEVEYNLPDGRKVIATADSWGE